MTSIGKYKRIKTISHKLNSSDAQKLSMSIISAITHKTELMRLEDEMIENLRIKAFNRINSRAKSSVVVDKTWLLDDSELNYIPIPERKSVRFF